MDQTPDMYGPWRFRNPRSFKRDMLWQAGRGKALGGWGATVVNVAPGPPDAPQQWTAFGCSGRVFATSDEAMRACDEQLRSLGAMLL